MLSSRYCKQPESDRIESGWLSVFDTTPQAIVTGQKNTKQKTMADDYIWIVTDDSTADEPVEGQRGWGTQIKKKLGNAVQVPVSLLEQNMNRFLQLVGRLFKQVDRQIGADSDMRLDEVELSVEISGKGEIKLVAGVEGKSTIKLKFKRAGKSTTSKQ